MPPLTEMKPKTALPLILKSIQEKGIVKKDIHKITLQAFNELKGILVEVKDELNKSLQNIDKEILVEIKDRGKFEIELKIADDVIIFWMHSDVFTFDSEHSIWKNSYLEDDKSRAFCGMISMYNFLSDSFKYNRVNDLGYLIARLFINKDKHYFVEGKRQLGFLYNDFENSVLDKNQLRAIIESAVLYSLEFDLFSPPYDEMKQISVNEMMEATANLKITTGKRLGFRFQADDDRHE